MATAYYPCFVVILYNDDYQLIMNKVKEANYYTSLLMPESEILLYPYGVLSDAGFFKII